MAAYLTYWLENVAIHHLRENTHTRYTTCVDRYLIPGLGKKKLTKLTTPAVGLVDQDPEAVAEEPNLRTFRRTLQDARLLYFSDSYKSVAAQLPNLLRDAAQAVAKTCWSTPEKPRLPECQLCRPPNTVGWPAG